MLCWATILLSPQPATLLALDEPELGLHPAWMNTLFHWIDTASHKTQIILTTPTPKHTQHNVLGVFGATFGAC